VVDVLEWPGPAVDGRCMFAPISAVLDIVISRKLPAVFCLWWPVGVCRPFGSKGPGAIVFILCNSPPLVAVLGLSGAYESGSAYSLFLSPYPPSVSFLVGVFGRLVGKGGKAQSRFEESISGEGGARCKGAVALLRGRPKGDLGIAGEPC